MKNLLIFCGSAHAHSPAWMKEASALGAYLAQKGNVIIYGGAQVGLMGGVANGALQQGGKVVGVIPRFLQTKEVAHTGLSEMIVVNSMHERKTKMYELCDAAIVLPGGFGTMDEMFEFLTWAQLGLHQKPLGLLNIDGFYNHLLAMLDNMVSHGLLSQDNRNLVLSASAKESLLDTMMAFVPKPVTKWLHEGEQ